jgi:hypothetical protein
MADRTRKKYYWRTVPGQHCLLAEGDISAPIYWRTDAPRAITIGGPWFTHRVGRVLSFSPVVGIGTPPTHHPQVRMPDLWFREERHTRWRERGWESPNSDEETYTVVLCKYMYMYFVVKKKERRTKQFLVPRLFLSQSPIN